jgi:hypothetical protein
VTVNDKVINKADGINEQRAKVIEGTVTKQTPIFLTEAQFEEVRRKINQRRNEYIESLEDDKAGELITLRKQFESWFKESGKSEELTNDLRDIILHFN